MFANGEQIANRSYRSDEGFKKLSADIPQEVLEDSSFL